MDGSLIRKTVLLLAGLTLVAGLMQCGVFDGDAVVAESSTSKTTITVDVACSVVADTTVTHSAMLVPGVYSGTYEVNNATPYASGIGSTNVTTICNDFSGYSIYAIGYTGDTDGTTTLVGEATGQTITTGTATSGNTSNWAMKLTKIADDTVSFNPANLTIANGFDDFSAVPSTYTQVASYSSSTDATLGSQVATTYAVYLEPTQVADTYVGKVKYTLVHPSANDPNSYWVNFYANGGTGTMSGQKIAKNTAATLSSNQFTYANHYFMGWSTAPGGSTVEYRAGQSITPNSDLNLYAVWGDSTTASLYEIVASLNNGRTLTNTGSNGVGLGASAGMQANITADNSGVFLYDAGTFGTSSDAANTSNIYFYRGILDGSFVSTDEYGNVGSSGDSANYPNYVKLGNTCWRIVRTTGSGGVKMIYNGLYAGGTTNSCANGGTDAQTDTTVSFNISSAAPYINRSIISVGYTYNPSYVGTTETTTYSTLFGTNTNFSGNSTDSTMKVYLEGTWFSGNSGVSAYESILESSAGYCNDRSIYDDNNVPLGDDAGIETPYTTATSGVTVYRFGAYIRNFTSTQAPSLTCPRSAADLYTTIGANHGNRQLAKPVALLTADELSFAGSGYSNAANSSFYNANSYLRSGQQFRLFSPHFRLDTSYTYVPYLHFDGKMGGGRVSNSLGVRPAISLVPGVTATSGAGTATDPWVVDVPSS